VIDRCGRVVGATQANHPGDCAVYISYDTETDSPANWIKLFNFPGCAPSAADMISDGQFPPAGTNVAVRTLPTWLPSCEHCVVRWEWWAIHTCSHPTYDCVGMQQYATCADVAVDGTAEAHAAFLAKVSPVLAMGAAVESEAEHLYGYVRNPYSWPGHPAELGEQYMLGPAVATYEGTSSPASPPASSPPPPPPLSPSQPPASSPPPPPPPSPSSPPASSPPPPPPSSPSPLPASSPPPISSPPLSPSPAGGACAAPYQSCTNGESCCGVNVCWRKNQWYSQCRADCPPHEPDWDCHTATPPPSPAALSPPPPPLSPPPPPPSPSLPPSLPPSLSPPPSPSAPSPCECPPGRRRLHQAEEEDAALALAALSAIASWSFGGVLGAVATLAVQRAVSSASRARGEALLPLDLRLGTAPLVKA